MQARILCFRVIWHIINRMLKFVCFDFIILGKADPETAHLRLQKSIILNM